MTRKISLWGVGPSIAAAASYAILAGLATWKWPQGCVVSAPLRPIFLAVGLALILIGLPTLVVAARAATIAYRSDTLATTGVFGLVRNPIYAAWIVLLIPGLTLLSMSWPVMLTPAVAYLAFKSRIGHETEYLEQRFGEAYRTYPTEVNELIPFFGRRRR